MVYGSAMKLAWSHIVMYVRDLDSMVDFYTDILGFEVTDRGPLGPNPDLEIVFMSQVDTDHHQVAFLQIRQGEEPPNSVDHIAFRTGSLADVKEMAARLKKDGRASQLSPMSHGNAWSVYFKDPEGNGVEVFCDTPWHVAQPQAKPWDLAWSEDELRTWTQKEFGSAPSFGAIDAFYTKRAKDLEDR